LSAEHRVALVIGNGAYSNIPVLKNPANDARALARALTACDFELIGNAPLLDADHAEIEAHAAQFCNRIGPRSAAVFYFSGHGLQLGGENYIVPIYAGAARETHVETELCNMRRLLGQMVSAKPVLGVMILDACRSDPFRRRGLRQASGLAPMTSHGNTILSFATQPGNIALDGEDDNSPFALALTRTLGIPGLEVFDLFNEVGIRVREATQGAQIPWVTYAPIDGRSFVFCPQRPSADADDSTRPAGRVDISESPRAGQLGPDEFVVSPSRGRAFRTIQTALDRAPAGATITIDPGTYDEEIRIVRSVTLVGNSEPERACVNGLRVGAAPRVLIRDLVFQSQPGGLIIEGGSVVMENCTLGGPEVSAGVAEGAVAPGRTGITIRGADTVVSLRECRCHDCDTGIVVDGARLEIVGGTINGRWTRPPPVLVERAYTHLDPDHRLLLDPDKRPEREDWRAARSHAIAANGGTIEASEDLVIDGFEVGIALDAGASATLSDLQLANCGRGFLAEGDGTTLLAENCELSSVDAGLCARDTSRATLRRSTMIYSSIGIDCQDRAVVSVLSCRSLNGTGRAAAIAVGRYAQVDVRDSRIYGGRRGVFVEGLAAIDNAELFQFEAEALHVPASGAARLRQCQVHHALIGVFCSGTLSLTESSIHENRRCGVQVKNAFQVWISRSAIHSNGGSGVVVDSYASGWAELSLCVVFAHPHHGMDCSSSASTRIRLHDCEFRQNGLGSIALCYSSDRNRRVSIVRSHLSVGPHRRANGWNLGPVNDERSNIRVDCDLPDEQLVAPRKMLAERRFPHVRQEAGRHTSFSLQRRYYCRLGEIVDALEAIARTTLREWSAEEPILVGRATTVEYRYSRQFTTSVRVEPIGIVTRLAFNFLSHLDWSGRHRILAVPYEHWLTIRLVASKSEHGLDCVLVGVNEEEYIDPYRLTQKAIGRRVRAPSMISQDPFSLTVLEQIERVTTPCSSEDRPGAWPFGRYRHLFVRRSEVI
jgi:hypothetical protein